jgi:hypothetical protein
MFEFKETSENFGKALEASVGNLGDEYGPLLKQDIDDAIRSAERSFGATAAASINQLSGELNHQISHLKQQVDDSIRLAREEMAGLIDESLGHFRKNIIGPAMVVGCVLLAALAGSIGFMLRAGGVR